MKSSPLNKYYFDKSYIFDKHDSNHDNTPFYVCQYPDCPHPQIPGPLTCEVTACPATPLGLAQKIKEKVPYIYD